LYSDLNAEERKLAVMTQAAAMELDGQEEDGASSRALIQQRQTFEEILKLSAQTLSNKTEAETLVKLIRICAFIDHNKITSKLLEYLKPKTSHLDN